MPLFASELLHGEACFIFANKFQYNRKSETLILNYGFFILHLQAQAGSHERLRNIVRRLRISCRDDTRIPLNRFSLKMGKRMRWQKSFQWRLQRFWESFNREQLFSVLLIGQQTDLRGTKTNHSWWNRHFCYRLLWLLLVKGSEDINCKFHLERLHRKVVELTS